jgi:hypothetical protein
MQKSTQDNISSTEISNIKQFWFNISVCFKLTVHNYHITKTFLCAKHFETTLPLPAQQGEEINF